MTQVTLAIPPSRSDSLIWPISLAVVTTVGATAAAFMLLLQPVLAGG
jgi:hypothetical protein